MEIKFKEGISIEIEKDAPLIRIAYQEKTSEFPKCVTINLEEFKDALKFLETQANR